MNQYTITGNKESKIDFAVYHVKDQVFKLPLNAAAWCTDKIPYFNPIDLKAGLQAPLNPEYTPIEYKISGELLEETINSRTQVSEPIHFDEKEVRLVEIKQHGVFIDLSKEGWDKVKFITNTDRFNFVIDYESGDYATGEAMLSEVCCFRINVVGSITKEPKEEKK